MSKTKEARSTSRGGIDGAVRVAIMAVMCVSAATGAYAADAVPADDTTASEGIAEVIVTSQRREESLSKVPISITAITQQDIDNKGIKDITDVARFTPGISVDTNGTANIAIRGIASSGGSGTTGIYIDDTPIQMRGLAFNPDEALPKAFDMERVEHERLTNSSFSAAGAGSFLGNLFGHRIFIPDFFDSLCVGKGDVSTIIEIEFVDLNPQPIDVVVERCPLQPHILSYLCQCQELFLWFLHSLFLSFR